MDVKIFGVFFVLIFVILIYREYDRRIYMDKWNISFIIVIVFMFIVNFIFEWLFKLVYLICWFNRFSSFLYLDKL